MRQGFDGADYFDLDWDAVDFVWNLVALRSLSKVDLQHVVVYYAADHDSVDVGIVADDS